MPRALARWALCALAAPLSSHGLKPLDSSKPCNGDPGLCELTVDQVTWAGTHNADATNLKIKFANLGCLTDNHEHHMITELGFGLRFFDMDTCMQADGTLNICHGPGLGIKFRAELERVKDWMNKNPREVVILSFVNSYAYEKSEAGNWKLMERITGDVNETFGSMLYTPAMSGGTITEPWPKLGDLVTSNRRIIALWGKKLYYHIFRKNKKVAGFRDKHIWMEKYWTMTYSAKYKKIGPQQLGNFLEHFCDNVDDPARFNKQQAMILTDAYLTIDPTRGPFSFCNKDLAGDVNPVLLGYGNMHDNPLVRMQKNCWKKKKQVSLLSMDYTQYFPIHLDRMGRTLNERNFGEYAWIGGKLVISNDQVTKNDESIRQLLATMGGTDITRISVEKKEASVTARRLQGDQARRLAPATAVHFSISAPANNPFSQPDNAAVLATMKQADKAADGVQSVLAVCRDPGVSSSATRDLPVSDSGFDEGTVLTFTCSPPLVAAHGTLKRTCQPDGLFSGVQPNCQEAWTKDVRLMPFFLKLLLVVLLCLCICSCLGGCVFCCYKKCKRGGYAKVENEAS